jgi:hypothetical protein
LAGQYIPALDDYRGPHCIERRPRAPNQPMHE